jgi:hypothetical protein
MEKIKLKENISFILKVMFSHVITYIIFGILFMSIFHYDDSLTQANMRNTEDIIVQLAPLFQMFRGVLYGMAFVLIKNSIIDSKMGFLKLYFIMIIIGIFNTPATSPGSIEAAIYILPSNTPLNIEIGGLLEILFQNLFFCILVCWKFPRRSKNT